MSRTWRDIPKSPYRNKLLSGRPLEEDRHPGHTEQVREKDNEGHHKCPKSHRKHGIQKHRSHERQTLREVEKLMRKNPTKKIEGDVYHISFDDTEIMMPRPKEFEEYYR